MKREKYQRLDSCIPAFLRESGLEMPLAEYRLVQNWPQVAGPAVARLTGKVFIKGQTLHVELRSSAAKAALAARKASLVRELNNSVQTYVISDIAFF